MRRYFALSLSIISALSVIFFVSCKKINLATTLGQDLIPGVDNINTFDTTIDVLTYNHLFTAANDSFNSLATDEQFLGVITNDPIFGKTDARMFFELKPTSYPYYFGNIPGKTYIDSVVLVLKHIETYGDTTIPQTIQVSELAPSTNFIAINNRDSSYSIRQNNFVTSGILGSATIVPSSLKDSIKLGKDTVYSIRNLRITLNNSFGQRLLNYDSTGANNAYSSDSIFKTRFKGFALQSVSGGNAIMGFDLLNANTRLAIYYRCDNKTTAGKIDTTVAYFTFSNGGVVPISGGTNYIGRDYTGTQVAATGNDNIADQLVYIQNTPGTYATLKLPALANMNNRIIHLAELQMESVFDAKDTLFHSPALFVDGYDDANARYRNLPYVLNDYITGAAGVFTINPQGYYMYGCYPFTKNDQSGNRIKQWKFNLTRYVQRVVNKTAPLFDLRLYAPTYKVLNDSITTRNDKTIIQLRQSALAPATISVSPAIGRVRLGGGMHPSQKMKMRIVYSKI